MVKLLRAESRRVSGEVGLEGGSGGGSCVMDVEYERVLEMGGSVQQ